MKDDITEAVEAETGTTKREVAVETIDRVLETYTSIVGKDTDQTTLGDLLADLMHWAAAYDNEPDDDDPVDFASALESAYTHFGFESDDEDEDDADG